MFKYPCESCLIKSICTEQCFKFRNEMGHLMVLANQAKWKYLQTHLELSYNAIHNVKEDLDNMFRFNIQVKGDADFAHLVHNFNKMYKQVCHIDSNYNRKVFGNGKR